MIDLGNGEVLFHQPVDLIGSDTESHAPQPLGLPPGHLGHDVLECFGVHFFPLFRRADPRSRAQWVYSYSTPAAYDDRVPALSRNSSNVSPALSLAGHREAVTRPTTEGFPP